MLGVSINQQKDTSNFLLAHLNTSSSPQGILSMFLGDFSFLKIKKESVCHTSFSKKIHPTKRGHVI